MEYGHEVWLVTKLGLTRPGTPMDLDRAGHVAEAVRHRRVQRREARACRRAARLNHRADRLRTRAATLLRRAGHLEELTPTTWNSPPRGSGRGEELRVGSGEGRVHDGDRRAGVEHGTGRRSVRRPFELEVDVPGLAELDAVALGSDGRTTRTQLLIAEPVFATELREHVLAEEIATFGVGSRVDVDVVERAIAQLHGRRPDLAGLRIASADPNTPVPSAVPPLRIIASAGGTAVVCAAPESNRARVALPPTAMST